MATFAELLDTIATENEFQSRLNQAKDAYRQQFGRDMPITSNVRTREQQEKLFKDRASNPNLVAAPGTSKHEVGEAADIPTSVPETFLNQFGIHRPLGKKDPVHAVLMPTKAEAKPEAGSESKTFADWIGSFGSGEVKPEPEKKEPSKVKSLVGDILMKGLEARKTMQEMVRPAYEVGGTLLGGAAGAVLGPVAGVIESVQSGKYGTPEGVKIGEQKAAAVQRALMPDVTTETGQAILGGLQKAADIAKIPPVGTPELMGMAPLAQAATQQGMRALGRGVVAPVQKALGEIEIVKQPPAPITKPGMVSAGAAAVPSEATIQQAMQVVSPELRQEISNIPVNKINLPTLQRHIEADTLPVPVRLTEGQATGDVVKLSHEQNRRGKDPVLAQRFNEQNGQLIDNLEAFRERAAPDAPGSRTIDHSQAIIDAYKELDNNLNANINQKYQALRDAAGGQFPVDAPKLLSNIETRLKKELLSNEAPAGQFKELQRLAEGNNMTFEDYLSLRRNLGDVARTATDGQTRRAASLMIEELEKLPLQKEAAALKPLADQARKAARDRFQMLEKDPAYRAASSDSVPADKFLETFVVKGHNKNVQAMIDHLGADSVARQHMAAGTINFLRDRAGIIDGQGNFTQAGYNKALKFLDDSNKMPLIFDGETATGLKTLGNVARYTQAQPRGSFVNNSNTLVGNLAEKAAALTRAGVEKGLNVSVPGLQLGTTVMEMRARRAAEAETKKALKPGAGIKQD